MMNKKHIHISNQSVEALNVMALKYRPNGRTSHTYVRSNELALIHQTEERKNNKLTY
jgi:hypothetical protein